MSGGTATRKAAVKTFFGRLCRNVAGNTLMIAAAAMIPLAGMVGGGIDMSRLYIAKTRLQHACDAGALAGRKVMGSGTWSQNNGAAGIAALQFFDGNYKADSYGGTSLTRSYTESSGKVSGTASLVLPMTLMRIFGETTQTLTVSCNTDMQLPNTDIMFVLDTTGSMGQLAVSTDTQTKIEGLKVAVKCFYEILAKLDTNATCTTAPPSGGTGNQVQLRFGFMPYSTNVNVGKLLPSSYFADSWTYQSREPLYISTSSYVQTGQTSSTTITTTTGVPSKNCTASTAAAKNTSTTSYSGTTKTVTDTTYTFNSWTSTSKGTCKYNKTITTTTYTSTTSSTGTFDKWRYRELSVNLTPLKSGSGWNSSFTLPIGASGTAKTINWDGCIEERATVSQTSYTPVPAGAEDLDIDQIPDPAIASSLWAPALPDLTYLRQMTSSWDQVNPAQPVDTTADFYNRGLYYCPTEAKKLQLWPDPTAFASYVDSLTPSGNTYHDIGMIWGARFMSPTGIFASENALTPNGGKIDRHMIFMTDGDANGTACDYSAYGVQFLDPRTTTDVGTASGCPYGYTAINNQINARLDALCTVVKNMNITLWVISFGSGSNTATETRLSNCASSGKFFTARDSATLQTTFKSIADQISQLRLTA